MKYCPYCGAALLGSAVSFCSECGESIPGPEDRENIAVPQTETESSGASAPQRSRKPPKKRRSPPAQPRQKKKRRKKPVAAPATMPDRRDIGYDGYYDDVQPEDDGFRPERLDPEVMKRVGLIIAGALVAVVLSVVIMYVL